MIPGRLLSLDETAHKLRYTVEHTRRLLASNQLPGYKRLGRWYCYEGEIDQWIKTGVRYTQDEMKEIADRMLAAGMRRAEARA